MEANQSKEQWFQTQLKEANQLVSQGGQALRSGQTQAGSEALTEAAAILDMVEMESEEYLKIRARVLNELGVVYQRQNQLERSRDLHSQAAQICEELIENGETFHANGSATHLNLSSIELALGNVGSAEQAGNRALELIAEVEAKEEVGGPDPLRLGALQNLAVIAGRKKEWDLASERMEKAQEIVALLVEGGQKNFLAQFAQGCQQLSVILFEADQSDRALDWGRRAEEHAERAYEALGAPVLPVYVISQLNLISYYEKLGQFANGEDCLWKALDVAGNDPRILYRGVAFYENCRKQADPVLEEGNLPREEVNSGLEELMERVEILGGMDRLKELAQTQR